METEGWNDQENIDYKTKGSKVVKKDPNTQRGLRVRTNVPVCSESLNSEPTKTEGPHDERSNKYKKCDGHLGKENDSESDLESDLSLLDIQEENINSDEEKEQQQPLPSPPLAEKSWSGNCEEFLAFEPTEIPPWRDRVEGNSSIPPVSQMIRDIGHYRDRYQELKLKTGKEERRHVKRDLLLKFLYNVQKEENIGSQVEGDTAEIMEMIDREDEKSNSPSDKRKLSDGDCEMSAKKLHVETEESPEYETFPSIEYDLEPLHDSISTHQGKLPSKSKLETMNLYRAYKHIMTELNNQKTDVSTKMADQDDFGLIEMNALINETHRILMEGVMKDAQMPGRFCTNRRETKFRGRDFKYPWFHTETVVDKAVETIIDKYNDILDAIKQRKVNKEEKLGDTFKIASLFLFSFLTLHPFGDGNGRLARLLASYTMRTFSPFMTPIYNVFSSSTENDYIQALVDARDNLQLPEEKICNSDESVKLAIDIFRQKPSDLCAMLVESNWTMWRRILVDLKDSQIRLFDWEIQHQRDLSRTFEIAQE